MKFVLEMESEWRSCAPCHWQTAVRDPLRGGKRNACTPCESEHKVPGQLGVMGGASSTLAAGIVDTMKQKAAAEAAKTAAEADVLKQKAAAEAAKTAAEVDVLKQKAAAEVGALKQKAAAEAGALMRKTAASRFRLVGGLLLAVGLGIDYVVHDHAPYILWKMKARLRTCDVPSTAIGVPPPRLPVPGPRLELGTCPTLLVAPTGAGKSTLLAQLARRIARPSDPSSPEGDDMIPRPPPAPVALIRFRLPPNDSKLEPASTTISTNDRDPSARMELLASRVCEQVGFPTRHSLIGWAMRRSWTVSGQHISPLLPASSRLMDAFRMLFLASEEVFHERIAAGMEPDEAKCKLLFDEVQDLIKDERLMSVGGMEVFKDLAWLLVAYCVDRQAVAAVVAGSSALLHEMFQRHTLASGNRWDIYQLPDPAEETVLAELERKGFSAADARRIVGTFGTRLRLLGKAMQTSAASIDVDAWTRSALDIAARDIERLLSEVPSADAHQVAMLLDAIQKGDPAVYSDLPASACRHEHFSKVLYVEVGHCDLRFQDLLHQHAWDSQRMIIMRNVHLK